jgi:hypothetical protein
VCCLLDDVPRTDRETDTIFSVEWLGNEKEYGAEVSGSFDLCAGEK